MSRRPSWSDLSRAAAAGGLILWLLAVPAVPALAAGPASSPVASKPVVKAAAQRPVKKVASGKKSGKALGKTYPVKRIARNAHLHRALAKHAETPIEDGSKLGAASFYGYGFQGRRVANGERFDVKAYTAATNLHPLGTWLAVTRLDNERCVAVRVNDRMDLRHTLRIVDISRSAAERLRMISDGVVLVRVKRLAEAPPSPLGGACPGETPAGGDPCLSCAPIDLPEVPSLPNWSADNPE